MTSDPHAVIRTAGPDLRWLIEIASRDFPDADPCWLALHDDGECVGGLLFAKREKPPENLPDLIDGWSAALRLAQHREAAGEVAEQLAVANRRLADAQDRLARDRALVAVAEMAAGAAHEMNNPLMVISGRSQQLYHGLTNPRDKQSALTLHHNALRLSEMISQLMRFARPGPAATRDVGAAEVVAEALRLIDHLPERAGRTIKVSVPDDLPPTRLDAGQVARALSHLIENALQADDDRPIEITAALDAGGADAVVSVIDRGVGMDEATLAHAGEPFFSRQPAGRRRGMGLALATRLIESNGGSLRLESQVGHGTRATVRLPLATPIPLRRSA